MPQVIALIVLLNVFDAIGTQIAVTRYGGKELNPLMIWGIHHGWLAFWALKMSICLVSLLTIAHLSQKGKWPNIIGRIGLALILVVYLGIAGWHINWMMEYGL